MSGGSFNYLYGHVRDPGELIQRQYDLREMLEALENDFPDSRATSDTRILLDFIDLCMKEIEKRGVALADVWHAMEWWHSNDYLKDQVETEIEKYKRPESFDRLISWVPS